MKITFFAAVMILFGAGEAFTQGAARTYRVAGSVRTSESRTQGTPVPGIPLMPEPARGDEVRLTGGSGNGAVDRTAAIAADGSFEFAGVPPGSYTLTVTPNVSILSTSIIVGDSDLLQLQLGAQRIRISGKAAVDGGPLPAFQLELTSTADPNRKTRISAGAAFSADVPEGAYRIVPVGLPEGFTLQSLTAAAMDLTRQPFQAASGSPPIDIRLRVSGANPWVRVSGRVTGRFAEQATTVALSGPAISQTLYAPVNADGSFAFPLVLPGSYEARLTAASIPLITNIVVGKAPLANIEFLTPDSKNLVGEFVRIEPGEFMMGCSPNDGGCDPNETPRHRVGITKEFEMGKYEVTQAQWQAVMGNNPSQFPGPDRPVENVNDIQDAQEFISRLNSLHDGFRYRLPTEAEWEYAARAGSTGAYSGPVDAIAWYGQNSGNGTSAVGRKLPNAWGLYDMIGNVWEWVEDWYSPAYYAESPILDPAGPPRGPLHVLRGGSRALAPELLRVSYRGNLAYSNPSYVYGLRLVREVLP